MYSWFFNILQGKKIDKREQLIYNKINGLWIVIKHVWIISLRILDLEIEKMQKPQFHRKSTCTTSFIN